jgi:flagellar biosynthesis protein FliR
MAQGWVRFGGVRFLLATSQANVFLMGLPLWCTAIYLPTAVLGLAAWRGTTGRRVGLTIGLYLLTFTVVGAPFNFYWGFVFAPLLALGLAQAPNALSRLVEDAFGFPAWSVRPAGPVLPST